MKYTKKIITNIKCWVTGKLKGTNQTVEIYPDNREFNTYPEPPNYENSYRIPVWELRASLEGPYGFSPLVGFAAMTNGYKLGTGDASTRLFLVTLKNGTENEITANSLLHACERAERDHGVRNIKTVRETTPFLESPIDLNEELLPIQLPAFQACSVCLRPDLCASGRVCIDLLG